MSTENIHYVYYHLSVIDNSIFYVGVGKNDRVFSQGEHRNKEWKEKVRREQGFKFKIIASGLSKKEALIIEREEILKIGLDNLCNIVGEGGNSTAFKRGLTPWNKGLTGAQACVYKPLKYNGIRYDSVEQLIKFLQIGKSTFYRRKKKGLLNIEYVS